MGLSAPFSLDYTLESGQVFRWVKRGECWYGIVSAGALKVQQEGETLRCESSTDVLGSSFVGDYFRLGDPLESVYSTIAKDPAMSRAVQRFYGLRLIRQERWECLSSFLLATNANIPRIKKMVSAICERFGDSFEFAGETFHLFPRPEILSNASVVELRDCGLGYRAPFLKHVATAVAKGAVDFDSISKLDYKGARNALLRELLGQKALLGVGPKVADCALLYSFDKDDAFPIDVWMARALLDSYPRLLGTRLQKKLRRDASAKLSVAEYYFVSDAARKRFGMYAGYAQLYLYSVARSGQA